LYLFIVYYIYIVLLFVCSNVRFDVKLELELVYHIMKKNKEKKWCLINYTLWTIVDECTSIPITYFKKFETTKRRQKSRLFDEIFARFPFISIVKSVVLLYSYEFCEENNNSLTYGNKQKNGMSLLSKQVLCHYDCWHSSFQWLWTIGMKSFRQKKIKNRKTFENLAALMNERHCLNFADYKTFGTIKWYIRFWNPPLLDRQMR
jgi:hypothetical protein